MIDIIVLFIIFIIVIISKLRGTPPIEESRQLSWASDDPAPIHLEPVATPIVLPAVPTELMTRLVPQLPTPAAQSTPPTQSAQSAQQALPAAVVPQAVVAPKIPAKARKVSFAPQVLVRTFNEYNGEITGQNIVTVH